MKMILDFKSKFWGAHIILVPISLLPARGVCWGVGGGGWKVWGVGMGVLNTVALTGGTFHNFEMSTRQRFWCIFFQHGIPHSKGSLQYTWARARVCLGVFPKCHPPLGRTDMLSQQLLENDGLNRAVWLITASPI